MTKKCASSRSAKSAFHYFFEIKVSSVNDVCKLVKGEVELNKTVFLGGAILQLSKILVFDFYYNVARAKYGDKAKPFLMTPNICVITSRLGITARISKRLRQAL
jgi:hypothetical protein